MGDRLGPCGAVTNGGHLLRPAPIAHPRPMTLRPSRSLLLALALLLGVAGIGCGDDSEPDADDKGASSLTADATDDQTDDGGATEDDAAQAPATPLEGDQTVAIAGSAFTPDQLTVKVGAKVSWVNTDDLNHTATADDGAPMAFDTAEFGDMQKDVPIGFTLDQPGTYDYHCEIHTGMKGTIEVVG